MEQESEPGWQEFRDFKLPLFLPLALIDLIRRKRWERGSRRRSRGARTHLLLEPPNHSQLLRRRWGKEEGGSAQRDTGLRTPAARFPTEKSTFVLEQNKERTVVLAPRFSALNVVLSLDRGSQPWPWSLTSQGWRLRMCISRRWAGVADLGPPFEKSNPTPIPKDFRDAHLWEFLKAWDQAREAADRSHWLSGQGKFVLSHLGMNFCPFNQQLRGQCCHRISLL